MFGSNDKYVVQNHLAAGIYTTEKEQGKTSKVWENFLRVVDENKQPLKFVACRFCAAVFKHMEKNGTSYLWRHMEDGCLNAKRSKKNLKMKREHCYYDSFNYGSDAGEDRKMDLSSMVSANLTENSLCDIPGPSCEDQPMPLSPEQYLTEETDEPSAQHSVSMPQRPESYKLRHNNHLSLVLESLAGDESFMDVTLTAQGKAIKAHKSVLSAVSSYFKSVLKTNPCQHPIIIMPRDIRFEELNNIISYVYKGEMTVAAEDLPSLLRTAEILQVTGLTPSDSSAMGSTSSSILGQIGSRETKPTTLASNQNNRAPRSPTKSSNKKSHKFHSTPVVKEAQQNSSYSNDMSDKIDPLDFLNADMAYVKEEIESDVENMADTVNESETSADKDFQSTVMSNETKSSDSHSSKKSCPLSKKRKTSIDASSLKADTVETENNPDSHSDDSLVNQTALFVCPYCFQSHRPTEVLQTHLRVKHPSKPSFLCKCGKVTIRQSLYDQHVKICDSS